jgi:hypothetical protein
MATKEYAVTVADGAGVVVEQGNKRVRIAPAEPGMLDFRTLIVQADAYEVGIAGGLALLAAGVTVLALAPRAWVSLQPVSMERAS